MKQLLAILLLLQIAPAFAAEAFSFGASTPKDPAIAKALQEALEDFRAVDAGNKPIHAVFDKEAPLPTDGGTTYYKGNGYKLCIVQSLETVGGIDGYIYGPALILLQELAVGNSSSISHVTFYSRQELRKLLSGHGPN
jgi:hypothetical protein